MKLDKGDKVSFLTSSGTGVVTEILEDGRIKVIDQDGFNQIFHENQLAKVFGEEFGQVKNVNKPDSIIKKVSKSSKKSVQWEIDLHAEELFESHSHLSNHQILTVQIDKLKRFIRKAEQQQIRKILVIHGVGEGVLRREIHLFLRGLDNVVYHDQNFTKNGFGATLVEISYKR